MIFMRKAREAYELDAGIAMQKVRSALRTPEVIVQEWYVAVVY
jgi:hypothetical protein